MIGRHVKRKRFHFTGSRPCKIETFKTTEKSKKPLTQVQNYNKIKRSQQTLQTHNIKLKFKITIIKCTIFLF